MASKLFQVFNFIPTGNYGLFKARIVAKNGQVSAWTDWQYIVAGDTTAPTVPVTADIDFTSTIDGFYIRFTDAYIATVEADVSAFRIYIRSRTNSGAITFDSSWTPTAIITREQYSYAYNIDYAATTYYHIWIIPEDIVGNWDTTPGAAQHQNKQPAVVGSSDITDISFMAWQFTGLFSSTDNDTVAWTAGTLTLANSSTYSIGASNTGNMAARTWIYFDSAVSTTAFQTTTTAATAVGANKILIAVAVNIATAGKLAVFQVFNGSGGSSSEITTSQLNFTPLISSGGTGEIVATINASTEGITIDADNIAISGSTTFSAGYNPTTKVAAAGGSYASAASGARVLIFPDANTGIQAIDDAAGDVFKVLVGGTDVGDVIIGNTSGQYFKFDKSAETLFSKVNELQVIGSSGALYLNIDTNYAKLVIENTAQTRRIWSDVSSNATFLVLGGGEIDLDYVAISSNAAAGGSTGLYIYWVGNGQEAATAGGSSIYMSSDEALAGNLILHIDCNGDIVLDPAGGDIDFDACDLWLDSGKHLSLDGSTDSVYITYDSGNTEILCSSRVNATGGFADNGTDGIDTTFNDVDGNVITVSGGIITAKTAP